MDMKILVVDDSPLVRNTIRTILEGDGYEVEEAEDGREALNLLQRNQGKYDLITLDVEMPFDGFRTLKALRTEKARHIALTKRGRPIPAVFITSKDTIPDRVKGFELGATEFIGKASLQLNLLPAINRILKPSDRLKGLNAMVVDDSPTTRLIVTDILTREGVTFEEMENGVLAYQTLQSKPDAYHVIITDLHMPEMDGMELTKKIRGDLGLKEIPILILSGNADHEAKIELFKAGANDYLIKPFIQEELVARLGVHLEANLANRRLQESLTDLKKSQEELIVSSNERKELLHVLCHDLANPLASIVGILQLQDDDIDIDLNEYGEMMLRSAQNGLEIIEMIRQLRALEDKKPRLTRESVNLKLALEESLSVLDHRLRKKQITVDYSIPDDLELNVEPVSFKNSILNNILTNAIKFSPRGEVITVIGGRSADQIVISIRDNGIGMPESVSSCVFDLSKTTSRPGTDGESGTGFGMPLMKKFTLANGGTVSVSSKTREESPHEHGTEITLRLPVS